MSACSTAAHLGSISRHLMAQTEQRRLSRVVQQPQLFWLRFHIHSWLLLFHLQGTLMPHCHIYFSSTLKKATVSDLQRSGITFEAHSPSPFLCCMVSGLSSQSKSWFPVFKSWVGWAWRVCVQLCRGWCPVVPQAWGTCAAGKFLITAVMKCV